MSGILLPAGRIGGVRGRPLVNGLAHVHLLGVRKRFLGVAQRASGVLACSVRIFFTARKARANLACCQPEAKNRECVSSKCVQSRAHNVYPRPVGSSVVFDATHIILATVRSLSCGRLKVAEDTDLDAELRDGALLRRHANGHELLLLRRTRCGADNFRDEHNGTRPVVTAAATERGEPLRRRKGCRAAICFGGGADCRGREARRAHWRDRAHRDTRRRLFDGTGGPSRPRPAPEQTEDAAGQSKQHQTAQSDHNSLLLRQLAKDRHGAGIYTGRGGGRVFVRWSTFRTRGRLEPRTAATRATAGYDGACGRPSLALGKTPAMRESEDNAYTETV